MSRRSETPTVTLFPFLAVLVCTMGALILLLLVTTRQIRKQALQTSPSEPPVAVTDPPAVRTDGEPLLPMLAPDDETLTSVVVDHAEERRKRREEYEQALQQRQQEQAELDAEWERRLTTVESETQQVSEENKELKAKVRAATETLASLDAEQARIATMTTESTSRLKSLVSLETQLMGKLQQLRGRSAAVAEQVQSAESQQNENRRLIEFVASDPATGTKRRPILIECRADSMTFASEQVALSAMDLTGFTPDYNPLRAGCEALVDYFSSLEEPSQRRDSSKPYVLLVVRPGGVVSFYVARKLLQEMEHDFGYELVMSEDELSWPEADPEAERRCREAIEKMLAERERMAQNLRGGRYPIAGVLNFTGPNGDFHLQEVDELRNTEEDGLYIAGQRWTPPKRRRRLEATGQRTGEAATGSRAYSSLDPHSGSGFRQGRTGREIHEFPQGNSGSTSSLTSEDVFDPSRQRATADSTMGGNGASERLMSPPATGRTTSSRGTETAMSPQGAPDTMFPQGAESELREQGQPSQFGDPGQTQRVPRFAPRRLPLGRFNPQSGIGSQEFGETPEFGQQSEMAGQPLSQLTPDDVTGGTSDRTSGDASGGPSSAKRWLDDGGEKRRWGTSRSNGLIGIEKVVTLHVWSDRASIGEDLEMKIPPSLLPEELQEAVADGLQQHVQSWGPAPESFFWKPALKIVVHPGGNRHYSRLSGLAEHWGLRKSVEYVLDH